MPAEHFTHNRIPFGGQSTNILNDSEYSGNSERTNGFQKNTPIHSDVVNTALKQTSFVTSAILDGLKGNAASDFNATIDSTTQYPNVASTVQTLLSKQKVEQAGKADVADKVSKYIDNRSISDIFEGNSTKVKAASLSDKATSDSKGNNIANTYEKKIVFTRRKQSLVTTDMLKKAIKITPLGGTTPLMPVEYGGKWHFAYIAYHGSYQIEELASNEMVAIWYLADNPYWSN